MGIVIFISQNSELGIAIVFKRGYCFIDTIIVRIKIANFINRRLGNLVYSTTKVTLHVLISFRFIKEEISTLK